MSAAQVLIEQHLIDPEICIRCNTCEATCPVGAITHDSRNYVVDVDKCNLCMACVPPCPTGSIDNWRTMLRAKAYTLDEQLGWDELPAPLVQAPVAATPAPSAPVSSRIGSVKAPWSALSPRVNLYGPRQAQAFATATVTGNLRVTHAGTDYDTHHLVLDFGNTDFPVLEGQSIGVIAPGQDAQGQRHHPRQYSVASPRNGERAGKNSLSLTVKRVLEERDGRPVRGVASNFLCDAKVGDTVQVTGPFGESFLMPNHPGSNLVMICTGTGSAPMRAMTEWRRRQSASAEAGKLLLFFGARSAQELPYFGPLKSLDPGFIDINLAFSRAAGEPKRYVQDLMRERAADLVPHLRNDNSYFYVCGLRAMEAGVLEALADIARGAGLDWASLSLKMSTDARLHLETY